MTQVLAHNVALKPIETLFVAKLKALGNCNVGLSENPYGLQPCAIFVQRERQWLDGLTTSVRIYT